MTVRSTGHVASSSRVARARMNLVCLLFLCTLSLHLECTQSGFSPSGDPIRHQHGQPPRQQQQQQNGLPGDYYEQPMVGFGPSEPPTGHYPVRQMAQSVYPMRPGLDYTPQDYPPQAQNYPARGPSVYPMSPQHQYAPMQQPPMRPYRPAPGGYKPVPVPEPTASQPQHKQKTERKFKPSKADPCGAIGISEMHGYQVREYKIITKDKYELVLHRLVHPEDVKRMIEENLSADGSPPSDEELRLIEPKLGHKKPYILLHGLVGSSASFVRNVDKHYEAPENTYDVRPELEAILKKRAEENELHWHSTADQLNGAYFDDTSNSLDSITIGQRLSKSFKRRRFARTNLLDVLGDRLKFAYEFTQAYRKFGLPREPLKKNKIVSNSLAFTLSNFGHDVWMLNLRGNQYSRGYNGGMNAKRAEYWDFNLDTLVKEDLLASVNHVRKSVDWTGAPDDKKTIGIVSYSHSSLPVLALLNQYPQYQQILQPVIMMAPTLMTSSDKSTTLKFVIKKATQLLISQTGPFPNRAGMDKLLSIQGWFCRLPVASKLCNLMTMFLNGRTDSVKNLIIDDEEQALLLRDSQCGQTSTGVLRQIVQNVAHHAVDPKFAPYVRARDRLERGDLRRFIMIIRSQADEIATESEAEQIKDASIKGMILSEVVIEEPKFGHADFLFSKKNQFLVNAEVARMALVFDYMSLNERANLKIEGLRG